MTCPYCDADKSQLNNHVRMSDGDGHGPTGEYPDDWDRTAEDRTGNSSSNSPSDTEPESTGKTAQSDSDDVGDTLDLDAETDRDEESGDESGEELAFGDDESDVSEYECGDCGEPLEYLGGADRDDGGKKCPNCGERLFWSQVS